MSQEAVLEERKRRVEILLKELHYDIVDGEELEQAYSATIQAEDGFMAAYFIDPQSKFLEFSFVFSFPPDFHDFIRDRMDEMLQICYEFGSYVNIINNREEIAFSVFSKIYYAGLNYYALKETLRDFKGVVKNLTELLDIRMEIQKGEEYGDS
ncbi:hypothetical protein [Salinispira pacifica]|uniref:Uncharacterized protein n=1 Tax=Salinispira pacifica TaxID=1307761 RepID=V5WGV6_9SPIO|nr:hypothetical protein [Salinispira pacifica]AHC15042.1 hypothetical protein L21SP2_1657 [Salinispira pacifica]